MRSPERKKKFTEAVQHEMLTNYYLSRYDRFMSSYSPNSRPPPTHPHHPQPSSKERKNFKMVIRQRQKEQGQENVSESGRKNFRVELERKTSKERQSKQNRSNFERLEGSIINELYSPSPSKLESKRQHEIEIQKKTSFGEKPPSQPFILTQDEGAIEINEYSEDPEDSLAVYQNGEQYNRISEAIKGTFQRRSPSKQSRLRKKSRDKSLDMKSSNLPSQILPASEGPQPDESILFHESIRPNFISLRQHQVHQTQTSRQQSLEVKERRKSIHSRQGSLRSSRVLKKDFSRHKSRDKASSGKRSQRSFDDSLNEIIPNFPEEQREASELNLDSTPEHQSMNDRPPSELRESTHELSMISRFSMTSDEGGMIREHLEREINQNESGPYQNALSNLRELIEQYPHAWPIFVVGQRILEDRGQYDGKRERQEQQKSKMLNKINALKAKKRKMFSENVPEHERNHYRILGLVRKLAQQLE